MGERILYQVVDRKKAEFGPVVYSHWGGEEAPTVTRALSNRMQDRIGDVSYASARLVQEAIGNSTGSTEFGIWNADGILQENDSHGDGGIVLIDANTFQCECFGGYYKTGPDGFPLSVYDEEGASC